MADFVQYDLPKDVHEPKARMMEVFDAHVNRNAKDSIFCDLFSRPEYLLFRTLHAAKTRRDRQIQCSLFLMEKDEKCVTIHEAFS